MKAGKLQGKSGGAHGERSGGVMALVVVAVLAVATLSASMLQLSGATTKRQVSNTNIKLAFYMAESGLAESYQGLTIGKTGNVGTQATPARFGNGLFWVTATDNPDGTVTLDSVGMVGNGRAELSLVVERRLASVAALGLFTEDGLTLQPGMNADGYDSGASIYEKAVKTSVYGALTTSTSGGLLGGATSGTTSLTNTSLTVSAYEDTPLGKLGSNGDIVVNGTSTGPIVVDGDATAGPGFGVTTNTYGTVNGSTQPADAPTLLPPVTVPSYPPSAGVNHTGLVPYVVLPGQYQMPFLQAGSGSEVVIQGPATVVVDQLQMLSGATLSFDTSGGPVNLYVNTALDLQPGSVVSTSSTKAWHVTVQVPGTLASPGVLGSTGDFYGIVYAPLAELEVHSPMELYGSFVAKTMNFIGPVQAHYDQHLEEISEDLALPLLVSWRIVELSNPALSSQLMDPFAALGVVAAALPVPRDAHQDQQLDVTYADLGLITLTYSGPESAFDWNNVSRVYSIQRDGVKIDPDGGGVADFTNQMPTAP